MATPHFIPIQTVRRPPDPRVSPSHPAVSLENSLSDRTILSKDVTIGVRTARLSDVPGMKELIDFYAGQDRMLFRAQAELYETIREYHVAVSDETDGANPILGTAGLHVTWEDLAEIRGLAVAPAATRRGVGKMLVRACLKDALELGLRQVYTLTLVPEFFENLGFSRADRNSLHMKVWYECYKCPKFANCDEIAMIRSVDRRED